VAWQKGGAEGACNCQLTHYVLDRTGILKNARAHIKNVWCARSAPEKWDIGWKNLGWVFLCSYMFEKNFELKILQYLWKNIALISQILVTKTKNYMTLKPI